MLPISYINNTVAVIYLARPEEKYAVLSSSQMKSLLETIDHLRAVKNLSGVIITGPNPKVFCLGADINEINSISSFEEAFQASQKGQEIFKNLAALPCPVVAAISGTCVGGGLELALFCDWRVATFDSVLGLPEVKLGIIPGFGGTQTLPCLIGLTSALDLILKGRLIKAKEAHKLGLIDDLVQEAELERSALKLLSRGKRRKWPSIWHIPGLASVATWFAGWKLSKRLNRQHYPAPFSALEAVKNCFSYSKDGYAIESELLAKCLISDTSKNLVYLWKIGDELKKIGRNFDGVVENFKKVGVCGCGVMGSGIASLFAKRGFEQIIVYEESESALEKARKNLSGENRIKLTSAITDLMECECVIEAIWEDENAKKVLFKQLSEILPSSALICTNTSSIPINALSQTVLFPQRFLGFHFFNPAQKMPLVEIIRGSNTDDKFVLIAVSLANRLGKTPVIVEDSPGFLVNRMLARYLISAVEQFFEGFHIREIDLALEKFGFPMGPFKVLDSVGLDIAFAVAKLLESNFGDRFKINQKIKSYLEAGYLGVKAGKGFYDYTETKNLIESDLTKKLSLGCVSPGKDIAFRLLLPLVDEAYECWVSEIAGKKSFESQAQIDVASVFGFGFPAFLGGVLRWAKSDIFLKELKSYNSTENVNRYSTLQSQLSL